MSLYIDEEYQSDTLAELLVEVQEAARSAWYRKIEFEVWLSYCDLAKADVRAGRSTPQDHPMFSPSVFIDSPFDTVDPKLVESWEQQIAAGVAWRPSVFLIPRKEP